MFELIIKREDQSVYWTENFPSASHANEWIAREQTRPYWKASYTYEIVDHTPPPPTQEEIDAENQRLAQVAALKTDLNALARKSDLTTAEVKEAAFKWIKLQLAQRVL